MHHSVLHSHFDTLTFMEHSITIRYSIIVSIYCHIDMYRRSLQSSQVYEISDYQNARYVSSNEAVWRILEFPIHERDPPVQQLAVHLENGQRVYFTEETAIDRASGDPPKTTLTVLCPMSEGRLCQDFIVHGCPKILYLEK